MRRRASKPTHKQVNNMNLQSCYQASSELCAPTIVEPSWACKATSSQTPRIFPRYLPLHAYSHRPSPKSRRCTTLPGACNCMGLPAVGSRQPFTRWFTMSTKRKGDPPLRLTHLCKEQQRDFVHVQSNIGLGKLMQSNSGEWLCSFDH